MNIKDSEDHSGDDQKAGSECGTPALDAALTIHTYGKGKAVFAAFDPLDEATFAATPAAPYGNAYARVLTYLFAAAQPAAPLAIAGKDTPVQVNVTNKGVAADVRISVTATAVDMAMPGWQLVGNEWQYSTTLAVNAVASAPVLYVPYTNPLAINMRVETRLPGSDWTPYPQSPFNLVVTP